ncbi:putative periplasmic beta-glucosidase precursor [Mollisia scopiformis]|uniref:beta-glucosidase n=1 Tax=Mollisia scopiformis TaxID=149040 RepID=A0A194XPV9_MOLSC|nr:putative periplasmic beta-glucosidase precursor [Mollisia scopiformis]KUJ22196.1 putative periplasmic beta-glucosidase precursor [Mollisia scopiformis]
MLDIIHRRTRHFSRVLNRQQNDDDHHHRVHSEQRFASEKLGKLYNTYTFEDAVQALRKGESLSLATQRLLSELSNEEQLSLLDGDVPFYAGLREILCDRYNRVPFVMGSIPRLKIPGIRFTDGPRGVVMGASTAFPVSMARGATWDIELERRVGRAIGLEAKAQGSNYFAGVCVNVPRHPAWGRIQETYGEDPVLLGEFGLALTQGVQEHVMACVKHFALNSMENARFRVDVTVDEDVLHEVYLPHFRRIIEGGVASVMSSYNSVNGEWAGQSQALFSQTFSEENIEAPFRQQREMHLVAALESLSGELDWSIVNMACSRILQKELEFAANDSGSQADLSAVFCDRHRMLAREAAGRSMVLLKNESLPIDSAASRPLLPLDAKQFSTVAMVGRLANVPNTGDKGSSQVFAPNVGTPFDGIKEAFPDARIFLEDSDSAERAAELASEVDLVLCVVGYDATDEGEYVVPSLQSDPCLLNLFPPANTPEEKATLAILKGHSNGDKLDSGLEVGAGGDRRSLRLRPQDVELISAVTAANPNTVVSVIAAGAVIMEEWIDKVPALVMSWYAGSEGGDGLADVLFGKVDASGRLPFSIPKDESHLPYFDMEATNIRYDRWHGQNLLDRNGHKARFPLGFGLSYTNFSTSELRIGSLGCGNNSDTLLIHVKVSNEGARRGRHVIQVYGLVDMPDFPSRVLLGFHPMDLDAGVSKNIMMDVSVRPLQRWVGGTFVLPGKEVTIEVASFAGDSKAVRESTFLRRARL